MEWWQILVAIVSSLLALAGAVTAAVLGFRGKRGETDVAAAGVQQTIISDRWDDASELATKMREYIAEEVERQVKPFRDELERVKRESHEMNDAVRSRETQLWLWDQRGRAGVMPMLPRPLLIKLGLGHLLPHGPETEEDGS